MSNGVPGYDLTCCFALICGKVWNQTFSAWLTVINDCSTEVGFKGHLHGHSCCLCLSWILSLEFFTFELLKISGSIMKHQNSHCVLVFRWLLKLDELSTFTNFIIWICSSNSKFFKKFCILSHILNGLRTFFSNFIGCTRSFNLQINFLILFFFFTLLKVKDSFVSNLLSVSFLLLFGHFDFWFSIFFNCNISGIFLMFLLWHNFLDSLFFDFFLSGDLFLFGDLLLDFFLFSDFFLNDFFLSNFLYYSSRFSFFNFKLNLFNLFIFIFHIIFCGLLFCLFLHFLFFLSSCCFGWWLLFGFSTDGIGSFLVNLCRRLTFWWRRSTWEESIDVNNIFQETPLRFRLSMWSTYCLLVKSWLLGCSYFDTIGIL